jgi:hypothetical protein
MGEQRGADAIYLDAVALVYWLGTPNRSPTDFGLYVAAGELRRAVFRANFPDLEPPELRWALSWGVEANRWVVAWPGGQADAP